MVSDRTQTLTVELERQEIEALLANCSAAISWTAIRNVGGDEAFEPALAKLRTALSQPERRGDEDAQVSAVVDFLVSWRYCPVSQHPFASRSCLEDAAKQLLAALPAQPPAPVLSDEERERLEEIADRLGAGDGIFLRNLASQEHRGEEGDSPLAAFLRGKADVIERTGLPPGALSAAGVLDSLKLAPPAGEVGRLRERVLGHSFVRLLRDKLEFQAGVTRTEEKVREALDEAFSAAFLRKLATPKEETNGRAD